MSGRRVWGRAQPRRVGPRTQPVEALRRSHAAVCAAHSSPPNFATRRRPPRALHDTETTPRWRKPPSGSISHQRSSIRSARKTGRLGGFAASAEAIQPGIGRGRRDRRRSASVRSGRFPRGVWFCRHCNRFSAHNAGVGRSAARAVAKTACFHVAKKRMELAEESTDHRHRQAPEQMRRNSTAVLALGSRPTPAPRWSRAATRRRSPHRH